jgi:hypothetical protein
VKKGVTLQPLKKHGHFPLAAEAVGESFGGQISTGRIFVSILATFFDYDREKSTMARTVLFFGDSNTRGFGAGIEARFPALLETALAPTLNSPWRFAVGHSVSDFHVFPERLDAALAKHPPDVVVLQCPTGPATFWINYPLWIRWLNSVSGWTFKRLQERYIRAYSRDGSRDPEARRDALMEGKFVDPLYRWNLAQWNGPRQIRRWFAKRYGVIVKASGPRYVQLMCRLRDRLPSQSRAKVLILGLLPHSEDYYAFPETSLGKRGAPSEHSWCVRRIARPDKAPS